MTTPLIPSNTIFSMLLTASLGDISVEEQNNLWQQFLAQNGLTVSTTDYAAITTNADLTEEQLQIAIEFAQYIQQVDLTTYEATSELSPEEAAKELLIAEVYTLLVKTLENLTYSAQVMGNNITFLGQWNNQYADQEGRIANNFYIGGSDIAENVPSTITSIGQLENWTLGYARVSVAEYIAEAVVGTTINPTGTSYEGSSTSEPTSSTAQPVTIDIYAANVGSSGENAQLQFQTTVGANGAFTGISATLSVPADFQTESNGYGGTFTVAQTTVILNFNYSFTPAETTEQEKITGAQNAFISWLNTGEFGTPYSLVFQQNTTYPFAIYWNASYNLSGVGSSSSETGLQLEESSQYRAQKNTLLQQYVQNIQSRMQIIGNTSDSETSDVQQMQSALSDISDVCQSTIGNLSTILTTIFQGSSSS